MNYRAGVGILGPTIETMTKTLRDSWSDSIHRSVGRKKMSALEMEMDAALLYTQSVLAPILKDCEATTRADREGLGEFLKAETVADDRILQQRLAEMFRLQHDAKVARAIEPSLEKSLRASRDAEKALKDVLAKLDEASSARAKRLGNVDAHVRQTASSALDDEPISERTRKHLREAVAIQSKTPPADGAFPEEVSEGVRRATADGATGTASWIAETQAKTAREYSKLADEHARALKKYLKARSVVSSNIVKERLAKEEWDRTLDDVCSPSAI